MTRKPRYVEVAWADAWSVATEEASLDTVAERHKPIVMHTRGHLLQDDEIGVSLFHEECREENSYRGRTFIPKGMVITIEDFPPKRKPRKVKEPISPVS